MSKAKENDANATEPVDLSAVSQKSDPKPSREELVRSGYIVPAAWDAMEEGRTLTPDEQHESDAADAVLRGQVAQKNLTPVTENKAAAKKGSKK